MDDWIYKKHFDNRSEYAGYWHDKACHLSESSKILWEAWINETIFDGGDTYRMLMGLSFELLLKAFYVANGKTPPQHHSLDSLTSESGCKFSNKDNIVLKVLSGYITWEGRYPPVSA